MTALSPERSDSAPVAHTNGVQAAEIERVLIGGDLGKLTPDQRVLYYNQVCSSLRLNPLTKPFAYITLNGKLTLYALKDCTEQLRSNRGVSLTIPAREVLEGVYVVTARATMPDGRQDESTGAVPIEGLKGEARANAFMKAETKAKRRVTLSICGLGMLDEMEVESIPDADKIDTGGAPHGTRQAQQNVAERRIKEEAANMPPEPKAVTPPSRGTAATQSGGLPAADLPEAWVARFAALDAEMPNAANACLDQIEAETKVAMPNTGATFVQRAFEKHGVYERGLSAPEIKALVCEMLSALPKKKPALDIDKDLAALGMGELLALREPLKARLGEAVYRRVLQTIGNVDKANKITDLDTLRRFITALRLTPTPEHAPSPNVATDADLPEVLQPQPHTRELLGLLDRMVKARKRGRFDEILGRYGFATVQAVTEDKALAIIADVNDALNPPKQ